MSTKRGINNFSDSYLDKRGVILNTTKEPIKFKSKPKNLNDLFKKLFNDAEATYTLNGKLDCTAGRGRSYIAAYLLCRYYFPELSYKDMYKRLQEVVDYSNSFAKIEKSNWHYGYEGHEAGFWTCSTIGRARFDGHLRFKK